MYQVNAIAIGMILLIDGQTTEKGILEVLEGLLSVDRYQLSRSLRDLLLFLDNANLLGSEAYVRDQNSDDWPCKRVDRA
jgi:hypothetical protein